MRFGAIQKHQDVIERVGAPGDLSTMVLIQGDDFYTHSTAVLRAFALLDQPYRSLSAFHAIPAVVRDFCYKIVARNRYLMFGKTDECRAPTEEFESRFLDYVPGAHGTDKTDTPAFLQG